MTTIGVLGLIIQANCHDKETIHQLEKNTQLTMRIIARVANRLRGMKEDLIRFIQAFVLSRITYVAPFLHFRSDERIQVNGIIRNYDKQAIGLRVIRFEALRIRNTLDELLEAQRTAHYKILSHSHTGRHILRSLGIRYKIQKGPKEEIPAQWRAHLYVPHSSKT